jgi:hypothetical protein
VYVSQEGQISAPTDIIEAGTIERFTVFADRHTMDMVARFSLLPTPITLKSVCLGNDSFLV